MKLGRLQNVPVREIWQHEALNFTPWLALSENISLLAETLEIGTIQVEATEMSVGRFSADIVGRDDNNDYVLIENQLAATDHRHLGQALTYLAGLDGPATVIWISTEFLEEHRAAIDWLNSHTSDEFAFFGVQLEAVRIGESDVAPRFNVVAKPNSFVREAKAMARAAEELAPRHHMRIAYWQSFSQFLSANNSRFKITRTSKDHWFEFSLGRSGFVFSATLTPQKERIGMELYIHDDVHKHYFKALYREREAISMEFGDVLDWQELPTKKASRVACFLSVTNFADQSTWPDLHRWMLEKLSRFDQVFTLRVKNLRPAATGETLHVPLNETSANEL